MRTRAHAYTPHTPRWVANGRWVDAVFGHPGHRSGCPNAARIDARPAPRGARALSLVHARPRRRSKMPPKAPESKAAKAAKAMAGGKKKSKVRDDGRWMTMGGAGVEANPIAIADDVDALGRSRARVGSMRAEMRGCV